MFNILALLNYEIYRKNYKSDALGDWNVREGQ